MTISVPDSVLKRIGLGLLSLLAIIGVAGIVNAVSHKSQNNTDVSNTPQEQTGVYLDSSTNSESPQPTGAVPQENSQSSSVSNSQPASVADLLTKKLIPE